MANNLTSQKLVPLPPVDGGRERLTLPEWAPPELSETSPEPSKPPASISRVAFIGNYLPRKCGIATFTTDLCGAVAAAHPQTECFAVPVNDTEGGYEYPDSVRFELQEQDLQSYQRAADFLNISNVDLACLQHEFGIFGGPAGSHVLALLRELKMPVVTTLHTLLSAPSPEQRRVMRELIARSARLVVMAERGRQMLQEVYQAPSAKIDVIPHGIPDMPFVDPNYYKDQFRVEGRTVLLTFGLLSPNKGLEHVLNALPRILAEFPDVVYIILGATHPNELREQGEAYRLSLERRAQKNNVQKNVIFYNRFVETGELLEFIGAADIYITPYLNEAQITSGTLAYAFGTGKAVISTPYWHAAELLTQDRGLLVPFGDAAAIAREVTGLLRDETRRHTLRKNAYRLGREMVWSNVARLYLRSCEQARLEGAAVSRKIFATKTLDQVPRDLPEIKLAHLERMTDATGLFQHAMLTVPNFAEGYCTDDNARAFILTVLLDELEEKPDRLRALGTTYAAFLNHAFDVRTKRFHNFMSFDRRWLDERGSEDSHGRALWALGLGVGRSPYPSFRVMAGQLLAQALPAVTELTSPRAWAFSLLGLHEYLRRLSGDRFAEQAREMLTARLMESFDKTAQPDWPWFEEQLTYDNAKLPHALILSGQATRQQAVLDRGLQTLRWLAGVQTSEHDHFRPIGSNGFYRRGGTRANFDQQPIEAHATISACLEAYRATDDVWWYEQAQRAFDWFLGWNDLGLELYASTTGGCRDALHVDRVNENQGAESTLAFLLSLAEMQSVKNAVTVFNRPTS
jgi:glycosyltransferase involved in cell wall biosynthesis